MLDIGFLFVSVSSVSFVFLSSVVAVFACGTVCGSVSKICCQCLSCCAGDIWENSVGENGGGGVGGGLCSRFCGDGPSL